MGLHWAAIVKGCKLELTKLTLKNETYLGGGDLLQLRLKELKVIEKLKLTTLAVLQLLAVLLCPRFFSMITIPNLTDLFFPSEKHSTLNICPPLLKVCKLFFFLKILASHY